MAKISVSENAEFLKMDYNEFVNWCAGILIVSIGKGEFQHTLYDIIRYAGDWRIYNTK